MFLFHRAFENKIISSSSTKPYLILFYGDLCFPCFHIEPIWQKIINELEPIGVQFATVHAQHEFNLARKVGLQSLPHIISVVDGQFKSYKEVHISLSKIIEFIRNSMPSSESLIPKVNDKNYEQFLSDWQTDNRIRGLFINEEHFIKLRYLIIAFEFRDRIAFGHVTLDNDSDKIIRRYHVDSKLNSLLIFNEDITRTTATLSLVDLKPQLMRDVLEANKFLILPRLASQQMFEQLCPTETVGSRRRLCIVLVTNNIKKHDDAREDMRQFIRENQFSKERFRFMYLFEEKQTEFVKALTIGHNISQQILGVIVIWRREQDRVLYEWLGNKWDVEDRIKFNETKQELSSLLTKLIQANEKFSHDAHVVPLIDEHASGLVGRIVKKILLMTDSFSDNLTRKEILPIVSVVISIAFIVLIGYSMAHLV